MYLTLFIQQQKNIASFFFVSDLENKLKQAINCKRSRFPRCNLRIVKRCKKFRSLLFTKS